MEQTTTRGFRDLIAWQKADELASLVYRSCSGLSAQNRWLVDQVLRCAISVPPNIAEGHGRGSKAELHRFIDISRGSLSELEYYLHFMRNEGLLPPEKLAALDEARIEAARVMFGLWRSLKAMRQEHWDHAGSRLRDERGVYVAS